MIYYEDIKPIPKNSTSYAGYARDTDKPVSIFADFETTSVRWYIKSKDNDEVIASYKSINDIPQFIYEKYAEDIDCELIYTDEHVKVWLAGAYVLEEDKFYYMTSMEAFINFIAQYKLADVYFHNGGNFDFRFIHQYLIEEGFDHIKAHRPYYTQRFFVGDYNSSTIYNEGQMANLRDSSDIIKSSIKEMGKNLSVKRFSDVPKSLKDYYKYNKENKQYEFLKGDTPIKYNDSDLKPSKEDLDYLFRDVMILALSSTREDSYDLPKFFSNGLRTTATLAEAYLNQPSLKDELVQQPFTLDNVPLFSKSKARLVTGWQFSSEHNDEVALFRDNGTGGKHTEDYTPTIDEANWLHSNYGIHSYGNKYLKHIGMEDSYDLSYEWSGDYLEYKLKKNIKIKVEKLPDPNAFDQEKKTKTVLPKVSKYLSDKKYLTPKGKIRGASYRKVFIKNLLAAFKDILSEVAKPLSDHIKANEALGFNKTNYVSNCSAIKSGSRTLKGLKTDLEKVKDDLKRIRERINEEQHLLSIEETKDSIHNSYKGGTTVPNPLIQDQWLYEEGTVADINSQYPWIYSKMPLPGRYKTNKANGSFRFDKYDETEELGFVVIKNLKVSVKEGRFPFYKLRANVLDGQQTNGSLVPGTSHHDHYLPKLDIWVTHCITLLEYRSLLENYDIEELEIDYFIYCERNTELMAAFKKHADYWMRIKEKAKAEGNLFMVMFSKLMLNSPYGKLGNYKKSYDSGFVTEVTDNGEIKQVATSKDDITKLTANIEAASYITAYGRIYIAECINKLGLDKFRYTDTDSIHYKGDADLIDNLRLPDYLPEEMRVTKVHDTHIGAWAIEGKYNKAKYIKAKCYGESIYNAKEDKFIWETTVAGVNGNIPEKAFKTYEKDSPIYTLRSENVKGGVSLYMSNFTIAHIEPFYKLLTHQTLTIKDLERIKDNEHMIRSLTKKTLNNI